MSSERCERMRELGRKGGLAKWAKVRAALAPLKPYPHAFLTFRDAVGRGGPSRALWEVLWRAVDGLPLDEAQLEAYRRHTERQDDPSNLAQGPAHYAPVRDIGAGASANSRIGGNKSPRANTGVSRPGAVELTLGWGSCEPPPPYLLLQ